MCRRQTPSPRNCPSWMRGGSSCSDVLAQRSQPSRKVGYSSFVSDSSRTTRTDGWSKERSKWRSTAAASIGRSSPRISESAWTRALSRGRAGRGYVQPARPRCSQVAGRGREAYRSESEGHPHEIAARQERSAQPELSRARGGDASRAVCRGGSNISRREARQGGALSQNAPVKLAGGGRRIRERAAVVAIVDTDIGGDADDAVAHHARSRRRAPLAT